MLHTHEELREEAKHVHSLILKGALTPHQLYLWIKPKLAEQEQTLKEKIESMRKGFNPVGDDWVYTNHDIDYSYNMAIEDVLLAFNQ